MEKDFKRIEVRILVNLDHETNLCKNPIQQFTFDTAQEAIAFCKTYDYSKVCDVYVFDGLTGAHLEPTRIDVQWNEDEIKAFEETVGDE